MLGIGTWEFPVNIMVYKGTVQMDITDNGGVYGFALRVPNYEVPDVTIQSVAEADNTLKIVARVAMFKNKDIPVTITFDGETASGTVKAPFVGRIKLNNGRKIA